MKRYWTWSREQEWHLRSLEQTTVFYRAGPLGKGGHPTNDGTNPLVWVYDTLTGQTLIQALYDQRYGIGVIITPPPVINWQSPPVIAAGSSDITVPPGNYLNEDTTKPMFRPRSGTGRLYVADSRLHSVTPIIGGFFGRATIVNSELNVIRPTTPDVIMPRLLSCEAWADLVFEHNTVLNHGRGIYITGTPEIPGNNNGPKKFYGNRDAGEGFTIRYNRIRNVDGRWYGRKSNWTPTKNRDYFLASGAQYGAEVANFIQFNGTPMMGRCIVAWNEVLSELGCWAEDMISMFGGSGGWEQAWALFFMNLISNTGGYDWNFVPGESAAYDASEKITLNADPGNTTNYMNYTGYSGTNQLVGDGTRTDEYAKNSSYVHVKGLIGLGYRSLLSIQSGHHNVLEDNEIYVCDRHHSGVPYTNTAFNGYQITDYHPGTTANDNDELIFGYNEMLNNKYFNGGSGPMSVAGDILDNHGKFEGNTLGAKVTDGGAARIILFNQQAQAQGITLGATLSA
jgi:hypothetical protein